MISVYVAGPYSADTVEERNGNIRRAALVAQHLARQGYAVFCPHTMTAGWENIPGLDWDMFMEMDLHWLSKSDRIVMVPGFESSKGAMMELNWAMENDMPYAFAHIIGEDVHVGTFRKNPTRRYALMEISNKECDCWECCCDSEPDRVVAYCRTIRSAIDEFQKLTPVSRDTEGYYIWDRDPEDPEDGLVMGWYELMQTVRRENLFQPRPEPSPVEKCLLEAYREGLEKMLENESTKSLFIRFSEGTEYGRD